MILGDSFFTPQGDDVDRHLWVILSDPEKHDDVVFANLSTKRGPNNPPCIVGPNEHPSLSKDSFVRCEEARRWPKSDLEALLSTGTLSSTRSAPAALITKMQQALDASKVTPIGVKELLRIQGFIS